MHPHVISISEAVIFFGHFTGSPGKLQQLASLPIGSPLWVQIGQTDELAEADLRYIGPLTRGSSAVLFGVQLKVNSGSPNEDETESSQRVWRYLISCT